MIYLNKITYVEQIAFMWRARKNQQSTHNYMIYKYKVVYVEYVEQFLTAPRHTQKK
jgi:hypothetical protein